MVNAVGELVRIEISGTQTVIGSAFTDASDLEFGPDGALYVSEFNNDDILRVAAAPPAAVPGLHGLMPLGVLIAGLSASVLAIGGGRIPRR